MQYSIEIAYEVFLNVEKTFYLRNRNRNRNSSDSELRLPPKNTKGTSQYFNRLAEDIEDKINYKFHYDFLQRRRREVEDRFFDGKAFFDIDVEKFEKLYEYAFDTRYTSEKDHFVRFINKHSQPVNKHKALQVDSSQAKFFTLVQKKFEKKLVVDGYVKSIETLLSEEFKIPKNDVRKFITAVPTTIFSYLTGQATNFKFRNLSQLKSLRDSESLLLCHALSIHSDSVFLLADIGRFARLSRIFKQETTPVVFLTGIDFGKLNWVVQKYQGTIKDRIHEIDDILRHCFEFRKKLYSHLKFKVVTCDWDNIKSEKYFEQLNSTTVSARAEGYSKLMRIVMGDTDMQFKEKLTPLQVKEATHRIDEFIPQILSNDKVDNVLQLRFLQSDLSKHLDVIKMVVDNFSSYSEETFRYFLLQYYHQFKFDKHLKVAINRESNFDNTFHVLKNSEEDSIAREYELYGLYFKDYECVKGAKTYTVHPYYFPSGTLQQNCDTLKEAERSVILLKDQMSKIRSVVESYESKLELSFLMSDLLSFAYFFFYHEGVKPEDFDTEFKSIAKDLGSDFLKSWESFTNSKSKFDLLLNQFEENILTYYGKETIIPFWYYPYIFSLNDESDINIHEVYSKIIDLILRKLEKQLGFGDDLHHWSLPIES